MNIFFVTVQVQIVWLPFSSLITVHNAVSPSPQCKNPPHSSLVPVLSQLGLGLLSHVGGPLGLRELPPEGPPALIVCSPFDLSSLLEPKTPISEILTG